MQCICAMRRMVEHPTHNPEFADSTFETRFKHGQTLEHAGSCRYSSANPPLYVKVDDARFARLGRRLFADRPA